MSDKWDEEIVIQAKNTFGSGWEYEDGCGGFVFKAGKKQWTDADGDGIPGVNCIGVVKWGLIKAGYVKHGNSILGSTHTRFGVARLNSRYFKSVDRAEAGRGRRG